MPIKEEDELVPDTRRHAGHGVKQAGRVDRRIPFPAVEGAHHSLEKPDEIAAAVCRVRTQRHIHCQFVRIGVEFEERPCFGRVAPDEGLLERCRLGLGLASVTISSMARICSDASASLSSTPRLHRR